MNFAQLLIAFALALACGSALLAVMLRKVRTLFWFELFGFGWLLGAGFISLVLPLVGTVLHDAAQLAVTTAAVLFVTIFAVRKVRGAVELRCFPDGTRGWEKLLTIVALLPLLWLTQQAFHEVLEWDGLFIWEMKARFAFLNGGALPVSYFSDASFDFSHQIYPLFWPSLELWFYAWMGEAHQFWIKALAPIFFTAGAAVMWSAATRLTGRAWIGAAGVIGLFCMPRLITPLGGLLQGYVDLPLGILFLAAVSATMLAARESSSDEDSAWFAVAAALAGLLPWVKLEGAILFAACVLAAAVLFRARWRKVVVFAAPGIVVFAAWRVALAMMSAVSELSFAPLSFEVLAKNSSRVVPLLVRAGYEFTRWNSWSMLWPLAAGSILCRFLSRERSALAWLVVLAVPVAGDLGTYVFSTIHPFEFHVEASIDRLFSQIAPTAILSVALMLGERKRC